MTRQLCPAGMFRLFQSWDGSKLPLCAPPLSPWWGCQMHCDKVDSGAAVGPSRKEISDRLVMSALGIGAVVFTCPMHVPSLGWSWEKAAFSSVHQCSRAV